LDGVSWSEVQLVPSPPLLSSSGDADDGESGGGESSLRFRPCTGPPPPTLIPPDAGPCSQRLHILHFFLVIRFLKGNVTNDMPDMSKPKRNNSNIKSLQSSLESQFI